MKRSCLQNTSIQFRKFIWLTYIRPAVSYGSQSYYPNISDLLLLENFQKRVTRWVINNYAESYTNILKILDILPYAYYRIWQDLMLYFDFI